MTQSNSKPAPVPWTKTLRLRLTVTLICSSLFVGVVMAFFFIYTYQRRVDNDYIDRAMALSNIAANMLDGETIDRYLYTLEKDAEYEIILNRLRMYEHEFDVTYIVISALKDGLDIIVFDTDEDEGSRLDLGEYIFMEKESIDVLAMHYQEGIRVEPFTNDTKWGRLLKTAAPITRQDGTVAAYAFVSILLDDIVSERNMMLSLLGLLTTAIVLIAITINLFVIGKYVNKPLRILMDIATEKTALERVNHLKTELMRTVSHELRTPLAVMMGFAELTAEDIRKKGNMSAAANNLDTVAAEARRMTVMLEELSATILVKECTKDMCEIKNMDAVVRQIAGLYEKVLERKNVRLVVDIPPVLLSAYGNENELTQVIFNLLRNADIHTQSGTITLRVYEEENEIICSVTDTGTGIAPDLLPYVFERGISGEEGGMGFGLSICRDIMEAHGGRIWLESTGEKEKGTAAYFSLPVNKAHER